MGSDDLFKKRRSAKLSKDLARIDGKKEPLKKILIVCEGEKTEPYYFKELIDYYRLNTTNVIDVTGDCGSSPMCVFQHAKKTQNESRKRGIPYDEIYCVIDKDLHSNYQATLDALKRIKSTEIWHTINSVPCFEFWLLLHYTYTTKAYIKTPTKSSGRKVVDDLKKYIKNYDKGMKGIFSKTLNDLPSKDLQEVIDKSKKCLADAEKRDTDNPSTRVHHLVEALLELKKQMQRNAR